MKVLSIDWDFFQNVSIDVLRTCYPDGRDASTKMSEFIWGNRYAESRQELETVTLLTDEYNLLKSLLLNQNENCRVMIANSHVNAYDFILENLSPNEKVQLVNIDMHHDFINDNQKVDCGNWIGKLVEEKHIDKNTLKWISNKISFDMYGLCEDCGEDAEMNRKFSALINALDGGNSISALKGKKYDLIMLARSDIWSAPHLDSYFCSLVETMKHHFNTIVLEQGIDKPRADYIEIAKSIAEVVSEMRKKDDFEME